MAGVAGKVSLVHGKIKEKKTEESKAAQENECQLLFSD